MAKGGSLNFIRRKQRIILSWVILCFAVSYLPVTNSWYLSPNGRDGLTRMVVTVVRAGIEIGNKKDAVACNQSIGDVFKELKMATGKIKIQSPFQKGWISLIEINPDVFLKTDVFCICCEKKILYSIRIQNRQYQSAILSIDTPPPENSSV